MTGSRDPSDPAWICHDHDVSEHSTFIGRPGQPVYRASFFCKLYHSLAKNALRTTSCQPNGPTEIANTVSSGRDNYQGSVHSRARLASLAVLVWP